MLFQLILSIFPALAYSNSIEKASSKLSSPETYVNLGQFQMSQDNPMAPMRSNLIPMMDACKMGKYQERMKIIPMIKTCKMESCRERMMTIPSTVPRKIMDYGNTDASMVPMLTGGRIVMPQMIPSNPAMVASPKLNFKVGELANVGQSGKF